MTDLARIRQGRPRPPASLSEWARGVWSQLLEANAFDPHEVVTFRRALEWWDRSDRWMAESEQATGRERGALVKQALDASTAALRHWKALKFTDATTRRPGRPSGPNWSASRKAAAGLGARP